MIGSTDLLAVRSANILGQPWLLVPTVFLSIKSKAFFVVLYVLNAYKILVRCLAFTRIAKHCLENFVSKHRKKAVKAGKKIEEFECPSCRSLFCLKGNEDVSNMRGSHFIRNMVDVLNAERETNVWKCLNHCEKPSCCRCVSCEVFLCEECLKAHENWPAFKSHSVLTIEELKKPENQSKITGPMRCKEHTTKKLKFAVNHVKYLFAGI